MSYRAGAERDVSAGQTERANHPRELAVHARSLMKSYGHVEAVRGIDLDVFTGEVFALLGPNGAGKTTTVEILEGYRSRSGGEVSVLGSDPVQAPPSWRGRLGMVLQTCQIEPELTVRESLQLFAGYSVRPLAVDDVLEHVGLAHLAQRRAGRLSGGEQRRLDVGLGLIGDPELLFLDEPTTGFDPGARHQFWEVIRGLRKLGKTVILTTHYLDEAQALADRVAVMVAGLIVACGSPEDLAGRNSVPTRVVFGVPRNVSLADLPPGLDGVREIRPGYAQLESTTPVEVLRVLISWAETHGHELRDLEVVRPSLEDVYLHLTREVDR